MSVKFPIKVVKDIKPAIENFFSTLSNLKISVSNPWYPFPKYDALKDPLRPNVDGFGKIGIYIYSKPLEPWNVALEKNDSEIWYIGKTEKNNQSIRGRVWSHLEPMLGEKRTVLDNGQFIKALYTASEWDSRTEVPQEIRDAIILGKFIVYGIRLEGLDETRVGKLESHLIKSYEDINVRKPVFNKKV